MPCLVGAASDLSALATVRATGDPLLARVDGKPTVQSYVLNPYRHVDLSRSTC